MIHGSTRIVMRNPISGNIIKDFESENTFQSAVIAKGFRGLGSATSNPLDNSETRNKALWKNMVGGILLFNKSIPSNSQYMPKGTKMTANGSWNVVNNGSPTELGSWNETESSADSSAITMVYDWSTSQGNGKIASVCLTSRVGGYMGYGNPSGGEFEYSQLKYLAEDKTLSRVLTYGNVEYAPRCIVGNHHFQFDLSGEGVLTIKKAHVPLTEASVFDMMEDVTTVDCSSLHYSFIRSYGFYATTDDGKIYLGTVRRGEIASNADIYVWEIDPSTLAVTELTITNTSGSSINMGGCSVSQGKLFVNDRTSGNILIFRISNSAYIGAFPVATSGLDIHTLAVNLPNGLTGVSTFLGSGGTISSIHIYDDQNGTFYPTNERWDSEATPCYDPTTDSLYANSRYNLAALTNPLYLATINNITEVIKDSTLTMNVRYTLTEA